MLAGAVAGCRPQKPPAPPVTEPAPLQSTPERPPNELALRKSSPSVYPDFTPTGQSDAEGVIQAIDQSVTYLRAPSSRTHFPYLDTTHDRAVATLTLLR